ncbi:hypothetical protein [Saccharomonospora sp.]|uniref:hypothetical protein n=1 Tax=Saccharomonospora sp. TaxID=33913 RepID=UPI00262DC575|nr:hypothetical protein [Saccharomonospora sp.]
MPSSRRRLPGGQRPSPTRRPRVAGLRKPSPVRRPTTSDGIEEIAESAKSVPEESRSASPEPEPETPERPDTAEAAEAEAGTKVGGADDVDPVPEAVEPSGESPKRPETDTAGTADERSDSGGASEPDEPRSEAPGRRAGYSLLAALVAATLVLAGLAVFFKLRHSEASELTANAALVDVATTAEVEQAMSEAAERLFSIDYNDMAKTEQAAEQLLGNEEVRSTYDTLMGEYRDQASEQKIVVTTTAVRSAVVLLDGDRARVMVYVDQTATRAGDEQTVGGPAAMWFETELKDGAWKVVNMNVYGPGQSSGAQSEPSPSGSAPLSSQAGEPTEGN